MVVVEKRNSKAERSECWKDENESSYLAVKLYNQKNV